jgi:hypothetical protein
VIVKAALSFSGPLVAGWFLVQRLWPDVPIALRLGIGAAAGMAVTGSTCFLALLLTDSTGTALLVTEGFLAALVAYSFGSRRLRPRQWKREWPNDPDARIFALFVMIAMLAAAGFVFVSDASRRGGFDAIALWNMRGRLIFSSSTSPLTAIFDPAFRSLHPDYPLLLPSLLSRAWQYAGSDVSIVPILLAALFTAATIIITIAGLRILSTQAQSWIAACILLGTPFLLGHGASQYADIVVGCFMTTAVLLFCIYDSDSSLSYLPVLAGITAGAAACTKNEGILFLVVLFSSRAGMAFCRRRISGIAELFALAGGASVGILTLAVFRFAHSPANGTLQLMTVHALLSRMGNVNLHLDIFRGLESSLNFGQWYLNPMPLMVIHAVIAWQGSLASTKKAPWITAALVLVGMCGGYYIVYLLSPDDVEWLVQSSLDRLLLQLWPAAIILYCLIVAPRHPIEVPLVSSRLSKARVATALMVVGVMLVGTWSLRTSSQTAGAAKISIELDRTEVTTGERYVIKINGIAGPQVYLSYTLNDICMGQFAAYLGRDNRVSYQISSTTPKGTYRFVAVRTPANPGWTQFEAPAAISVK